MNLLVSYHFKSKFGDGFGDATITDAKKFPENADDINEIKERIKKESNEKRITDGVEAIIILNIIKLKD